MYHKLLDFTSYLLLAVVVKGAAVHYLILILDKYATPRIVNTERKAAIWYHYQLRAKGMGHVQKSVIPCEDGRCQLF